MRIRVLTGSIVGFLAVCGMLAGSTPSHGYGDEPPTSTIRIRLKGPTLRVRCRGGDCTITVVREGTAFHVSVTRVRPEGTLTFTRTVENPKNVAVETGYGNDSISLVDVDVPGFLRIAAGPGDDAIDLADTSTGRYAAIDTGRGNDTVDLGIGSIGGKFRLQAHEGNDDVNLTSGLFWDKAGFNGGPGADELAMSGGAFSQAPVVVGFE
jgi:hypothetical protein